MGILDGSFKIGRLFGIDIRVSVLLLIFLGYRLAGAQAGADFQFQLLYSVMLFSIILVHEFGHCFGARSVGGDANVILMWPLGGLAFCEAPMRPWPQFVTVACGPLVNVIFCLLSGAVMTWFHGDLSWFHWHPERSVYRLGGPDWLWYVAIFYMVNYWLLAFNLLPVFPMDGGQLLWTMLWPLMGLRSSLMLACQIGMAGALVFGVLGLQSHDMILVAIAFMGAFTCWQRYQAARYGAFREDPIKIIRPRRRPSDAGSDGWFGSGKPTGDQPLSNNPTPHNPNPGGWEAKQGETAKLEAEVDRILAKVHKDGVNSLNYAERATLERASRMRRERDEARP
ncbi:MAG: DUF6576 domain-containing protein [Phycisphaerae bacterium]|nr:DUF6576 domain-containing protein [Phycisphaerae bacterium]